MTKSQIIEELYRSKEINEAISKMEPVDLQEDLRQELFLILCNMEEEKILDMYEKGYIKFFLIRTMMIMIKSNRSYFYKNFRNFTELSTFEKPDVVYEENKEIDLDLVFGTTRQGLYEKDMFLYYVYTFDRNCKKLSQATKIPYITVIRTIKNAKCRIKSYLRSSEA